MITNKERSRDVRSYSTCEDNSCHGQAAMEVDGRVKGDVVVEDGLSTHCDEVAANGKHHVRKQEGDGGSGATGDHDAHSSGLWDTGVIRL